MMTRVRQLLADYGIQLVLLDLNHDGYYNPKLKIMFINQNLDEFGMNKTIKHELGHGVLHDELSVLYEQPFYHSKMEYEAECFMIEGLLQEYMIQTELTPIQVNRITFLESCDLDTRYEQLVQNILHNYVYHAKFV